MLWKRALAKMAILSETSELLCPSNCAPNTAVVSRKLEGLNAVPKKQRERRQIYQLSTATSLATRVGVRVAERMIGNDMAPSALVNAT